MEIGKLVLLSFYDIECAGVGGGGWWVLFIGWLEWG
jgi:hypothetical protein